MTLYREHRVYRHRGNDAALYVCFEDLASGQFAVQQVEFFSEDDDLAKRTTEIGRQTLEIFAETSPRDRCGWFPSIQQAIDAHDRDFGN